jgi:very-short-patch-repair endonuclease
MSTHYPDAEARRRTVLVAVLNNGEDLRRAASEGWYRIPQRTAPRRIGADYLAFYQTGAFKDQDEAQTVTYYAPTRRYRLLTRREILPAEPNHPRADEYYFRIELGPLQRLERPVPAAKFRRVTFIHTTLERLLTAQDVVELFRQDDPFESLWSALREHRLRPLKNRLVGDQPMDITLRARGGYLGIRCVEESATQEVRLRLQQDRWEVLSLSTRQITQDLNGCLRRIGAALIELGGSMLNEPSLT